MLRNRKNPGFIQNINTLLNVYNRMLNSFFKTYPIPLSLSSYTLLWTIFDHPDLNQYELSKLSGYSNQRCHQIINSLAESSLIQKNYREYSNKTRINISEKGLSVINDIYQKTTELLEGSFSSQENELFSRISADLNTLNEEIKKNSSFEKIRKSNLN